MARPGFDLLDLPADPFCTGESVTIFFDTEFTDLTVNSELLSIGLVADDSNAELYIEISDANRADASDFVRATVLPLFGQFNPAILTRGNAAKRIEIWLDGLRKGNRDRQVIMVSDSPWDWQHLSELLGHVSGQAPWTQALNVIGRTVQMISSPSQIASINQKVDAYHRQHGLQHHALVDARALKTVYQESTFKPLSPTAGRLENGD